MLAGIKDTLLRKQKISLLIGVGRYSEALSEIGSLLAVEPSNYEALCQKALCNYYLKEFQAGYDTTKTAIAASPESEWAYRLQSLIFTANGEHDRALTAAEISVQKAPYVFETRQTLFFAQANYGLLAEAKFTLAAVLEIAPERASAHFAAGYLALKEKELVTAENAFRETLKLDPENTNALNNLGVVYMEMANSGRGEKYRQLSVEMFERAVKTEPTFKLGQTNIRTAREKPLGIRRSAGFFAMIIFLASSPLQTILYLGFSDQINTHTSIAGVFTPFAGDGVIISLNVITIIIVIACLSFGLCYYVIGDRPRSPSIISTPKFWWSSVVISLAALVLYLTMMFSTNTEINSFPGLAVRTWLVFLIVSGINLANLRHSRSY